MKRQIKKVFALTLAQLALSGCARTPSVDIFGSFFPVWMFCLAGGVLLTLAVRFVLLSIHMEQEIGPRVLVYPSLTALFTCLIWMVGFHD